jgi:DNA-directed RNA polymerase
MDPVKRQIERETLAVQRGIARMMEEVAEAKRLNREYDLPIGARVVAELVHAMIPPVKRLQAEGRKHIIQAVTTGRRLSGWEDLVQLLDARTLAYLTVRSALTAQSAGVRYLNSPGLTPVQTTAIQVGYHVWLEAKYEAMRAGERQAGKEPGGENRLLKLQRSVRERNPRTVRAWLRRLEYTEILSSKERWTPATRLLLGTQLLSVMLDVPECPLENRLAAVSKGKTIRTIAVKPAFSDKLAGLYLDAAITRPYRMAMVTTPRPWVWTGTQYDGGFMAPDTIPFLVGARPGTGTAQLTPDTVSDTALRAVNVAQRTPWRVNTVVLGVVRAAVGDWDTYADLLGVAPFRSLPEDVAPDVWTAMSHEERGKLKFKRLEVHNENHRQKAKRQGLMRVVTTASHDQLEPRLYFPHGLDWRRRVYPVVQDLHPQADDLSRGLLELAEGVPLGTEGYKWLVFRCAQTYGYDKGSREEQAEWFNTNIDMIFAVASDPLGAGLPELRKVALGGDDPWQFLAACIEVCRVPADPEGRAAFVSHLPVYVDGTCNGLQHLSAMGRDQAGALATNLTGCPTRQDIYELVATAVNQQLTADQSEAGAAWKARGVGRSTVKRGVMTKPYGLTSIGMRDQLKEDRWTTDNREAGLLAAYMNAAIEETVQAAALIMEWLQFNAAELARHGRPFTWETPDGSIITQAYWTPQMLRVTTNLGTLWVKRDSPPQNDLKVNKQRHGIVPNLIHSFDAAHLSQVLASLPASSVQSIAVIHDSFGTHAACMDTLVGIIKQTFCGIYQTDWLATIQQAFVDQAPPGVELRDPPELGTWCPDEVLSSEFFFY